MQPTRVRISGFCHTILAFEAICSTSFANKSSSEQSDERKGHGNPPGPRLGPRTRSYIYVCFASDTDRGVVAKIAGSRLEAHCFFKNTRELFCSTGSIIVARSEDHNSCLWLSTIHLLATPLHPEKAPTHDSSFHQRRNMFILISQPAQSSWLIQINKEFCNSIM